MNSNKYQDDIINSIVEDWNRDVSIGGQKISKLRFADDTVLIAGNEHDVIQLLQRLEVVVVVGGNTELISITQNIRL